MFSCDLNREFIDAKPERVVSLIRSLNKIDLIPQDGGDGEPEPTEAFIAGVQRSQDQYEIFAYLYHERTHTARIYVWEGDPVTRATFADVEAQALDFIESMGFMMDNTQFRKQPPEQRQELYDSVPVFAQGGGKYRELLESKEDPSLLDLSEELVDLEENPDAFEEEKKVTTAVDVDAFEGIADKPNASPFDELETTNEVDGQDDAKNPFDDFDSSSGSEFDTAAFDDVAPPPPVSPKGKPASIPATETAGGAVSEMVEAPEVEEGALDALSADLDSALTDDGEEAEAIEVEDLPETGEIETAEDVEDIAEVAEPLGVEPGGIEIDFDEAAPPEPPKAAARAGSGDIPLPPAAETVDFGEISDDGASMGGAADFGEFLDGKSGQDETGLGDLVSELDDIGTGAEEPVAAEQDFFSGDADLSADLDKSLDDILSGPPAAKAAEQPEEVIEEDLGGLGSMEESEAVAIPVVAASPAEAPATPVVAVHAAASASSGLSAEERTERLRVYGRLFATL